jgi:serine/threonine-protein kinase
MPDLGARYRLEAAVGRGGMATVWRARDLVLRRTVAVKVLSPELATDAALVDAIRQEARSAAGLSHPHIAGVHDYGEAGEGDRREPFVVMEYVDGPTLAARIADNGPLDWPDAVTICAEVAEALAAAHDAGVVHRDIKPANVMLTPAGTKVVDFGVAVPAGHSAADSSGRLWGTATSLPPEQLRDGDAVPAGDVYALGLLLHECLTGRPPWRGTSVQQVLAERRRRPLPPPPAAPDVPGGVLDIYRRCLADVPGDRPPAREVARALREAASSDTVLRHDTPAPALAAAPTRPGRRRIPARRLGALVTAPTAVAAGVLAMQLPGLSSPDEAVRAEKPQSAAGGAQCAAAYSSSRRTDGSFAARLRMVNTGDRSLPDWRVRFAVPQGHRIVEVAGMDWEQGRGTVTVTANRPLPAGAAATVTFHGTFDRTGEGVPDGFAVNGVECTRAVTRVQTSATTTRREKDTRPARSGDAGGSGSRSRDATPDAARVTSSPTPDRTTSAPPADPSVGTPSPEPELTSATPASPAPTPPPSAEPTRSGEPTLSAEPSEPASDGSGPVTPSGAPSTADPSGTTV